MGKLTEYQARIYAARRSLEQHHDPAIHLSDCIHIALKMVADEHVKREPNNKYKSAAAASISGLQYACKMFIKTYRHYVNDPYEEDTTHHDVVSDVKNALQGAVKDEVRPIKDALIKLGIL